MKRTTCSMVAGVFLVVCGMGRAQDMRENVGRSLFADQKATRVGDAVTILVVEASSATNGAQTSTSRASNLSLSSSGTVGSSNLPEVGLGVGTGNGFKGEGATSTNGSVRAKLSARVDSVLANGNLLINGNRTIIVNGEEQTITLSGCVRPSDIQADNSVYSYSISEARIVIRGNGVVSEAQGPGWITKFLHWIF
jgi:flagellar L-ring protein precursor FlgH